MYVVSDETCVIQVFAYTKRQQIMSDDMCLDAASPQGPVKIVRCHGMGGNQAWVYNDDVRNMKKYEITKRNFDKRN